MQCIVQSWWLPNEAHPHSRLLYERGGQRGVPYNTRLVNQEKSWHEGAGPQRAPSAVTIPMDCEELWRRKGFIDAMLLNENHPSQSPANRDRTVPSWLREGTKRGAISGTVYTTQETWRNAAAGERGPHWGPWIPEVVLEPSAVTFPGLTKLLLKCWFSSMHKFGNFRRTKGVRPWLTDTDGFSSLNQEEKEEGVSLRC